MQDDTRAYLAQQVIVDQANIIDPSIFKHYFKYSLDTPTRNFMVRETVRILTQHVEACEAQVTEAQHSHSILQSDTASTRLITAQTRLRQAIDKLYRAQRLDTSPPNRLNFM